MGSSPEPGPSRRAEVLPAGRAPWLPAEAEADTLGGKGPALSLKDSHWLIWISELTIRKHQRRRGLATLSKNQQKQNTIG